MWILRYLMIMIVFAVLFYADCAQGWQWVEFEFYNQTADDIVVKVKGITPDPSCGILPAMDGSWGADGHPQSTLSFGETILVEDEVTIEWMDADDVDIETIMEWDNNGRTKESKIFMRKDLGIPQKITKAEMIRFIYTSERQWRIDYRR